MVCHRLLTLFSNNLLIQFNQILNIDSYSEQNLPLSYSNADYILLSTPTNYDENYNWGDGHNHYWVNIVKSNSSFILFYTVNGGSYTTYINYLTFGC